jgi:hypothetical protein
MIFQIVGGRQVWRGKGVDREYLLYKLKEFHRTHQSPATQTVGDLNEAFKWLPKSSYREEAEQLSVAAGKRRRGVTSLGEGIDGGSSIASPLKSVALCQRFKRLIRQCGPEKLYGRASDIYQGGETEPSHADRAVLAAGSYWTPSTKKATLE